MYLFLTFTALIGTVSCDLNKLYEYCSPNEELCEIPSLMTLCPHSDSELSEDCPHVNEPLSGDDKTYILSLHNKLRNEVATGNEGNEFGLSMPSASNMLKLRWDNELESIGEGWVERCLDATSAENYDDCKDKERFNVTQNVGIIGSKGVAAEKRIFGIFQVWYNKSKLFNLSNVDNYLPNDEGDEVKEYANLIWADSYAIGCSRVVSLYNISDNEGGQDEVTWTFERIICNYVPGGNIPGRPVYKRGAPCSDCPTGTKCDIEFPGLCSLNEIEGEENGTGLTNKLTEAETDQDNGGLETVTTTTEEAQALLRLNTQTFPSESVETETEMRDIYSTLSSSKIPANEAHDIGTESTKLLVKTGIYFNGKCHCPDISRLGLNKKLPAEITQKLKDQVQASRENSGENEGAQVRKPAIELKQGDRCYCTKEASKGINISAPSRFLYSLCIFHFIKLVYYKD